MAIQPLDQRLGSMLPAAEAAAPTAEIQLEPMPAEGMQPGIEPVTVEPGTPSMDEGVMVAGPVDAAIRKLVTKRAAQAERKLVTERPPGGFFLADRISLRAGSQGLEKGTWMRQSSGALRSQP